MEHNTPIQPLAAVNVAVFNPEGKLLLTRRSPLIRAPGMWVLPGGHVEVGEDWETAAIRETEEEVGIRVLRPQLMGVYSDPTLTVTSEVLPAGYRGHFVVVQFRATAFEGEVKPNHEVDLWGWYGREELPSPFLKSHPIRVQDAFDFKDEVFVR